MFKRLHVLGSEAKFYAVSWYGYQSQFSVNWTQIWSGWKCPDYQTNVINAFATAGPFKDYASSLSESTKLIAAHSLGNMLVSAAMEDKGLDVNQYFMINAAVSSEAYSPNPEDPEKDMVHYQWGVGFDAATDRVNLFPDDATERAK
jgi:hypothetical protein